MFPASATHRGIIPAPIRRIFPPLRSFRFLLPRLAGACIAVFLLADCAPPKTAAPDISIFIVADGTRQTLTVPGGTTVAGALDRAGLTLGDLDRVTPPLYSLLADGATVRLIRVRESFNVEDVDVPFEKQVVRNEAMPADETRIFQTGKDGSEEITYRIVTEDGVEVSRSPLKTSVLVELVPEILMTGTTASFLAVPIGGALAYVDAGNAWLLTSDTNNRLLLTAAGDLDFARVFALT